MFLNNFIIILTVTILLTFYNLMSKFFNSRLKTTDLIDFMSKNLRENWNLTTSWPYWTDWNKKQNILNATVFRIPLKIISQSSNKFLLRKTHFKFIFKITPILIWPQTWTETKKGCFLILPHFLSSNRINYFVWQCCNMKPADPILCLANWLITNNPNRPN